MKPLMDIAKECGIQFGESDVSRDIISRRQLERVIAAALAQHQAKALEGVEPVAVVGEVFNLFWAGSGPIAPMCEKHGITVGQPLYSAATVSALQARIAELEQDAARGQVKCHKGAVVREFENEIGNRIKITIEGPTSTSENILTPMEATELRRALIAAAPKETP